MDRSKLAKLIPRLASNHDGEVIGTVAAIRRVLTSEGRDLHDLAAALTESHRERPDLSPSAYELYLHREYRRRAERESAWFKNERDPRLQSNG
jgi:hypothetical protein